MKNLFLSLLILAIGTGVVVAQTEHDGQKFKLFGGATDSLDPDNPDNEVISTSLPLITQPTEIAFAGVTRDIPPHTKLPMLDNQVELKYHFSVGRSCGGGSPRIELAIDLDGDRRSDGNAFGYVGTFPVFTGCPQGGWQREDLTDNQPRWDISQFRGEFDALNDPAHPFPPGFVIPWEVMEAAITAAFPNHEVLRGTLADDVFFGTPAGFGTAYYDLVAIDNQVLEDHDDTNQNPR